MKSAPLPTSVARACQALGVPRASYYRQSREKPARDLQAPRACRVPGRALTSEQQNQVIEHLHSQRFQDMAPPQVYATLLDEGVYLCSISTMYRLLRERDEVHEPGGLARRGP